MPKFTAPFDYAQGKQEGFVDPKIIIGGVIALVVIFFIATGSFKFSASIKKPDQPVSSNTTTQEGKQAEPAPQTKPKAYQNEKYGFTLEYPSSWSLKENPSASFVTGFFSPEESSSDNYKENLLVRVVDISKQPKMTIQEAADLWENDTEKEEGDNFTVTERKSSTLAGENAKDIFFDIKFKDIDGRGMVRITLKNKKAYIFEYNGLKTTYDKYLSDIETILASVKF